MRSDADEQSQRVDRSKKVDMVNESATASALPPSMHEHLQSELTSPASSLEDRKIGLRQRFSASMTNRNFLQTFLLVINLFPLPVFSAVFSRSGTTKAKEVKMSDKSVPTNQHDQRAQTKREAKMTKERELRVKWQKVLGKSESSTFKLNKQIKNLSWLGIPSSLRSEVWKKYLIQGEQDLISLEAFKELVRLANQKRMRQREHPVSKVCTFYFSSSHSILCLF